MNKKTGFVAQIFAFLVTMVAWPVAMRLAVAATAPREA